MRTASAFIGAAVAAAALALAAPAGCNPGADGRTVRRRLHRRRSPGSVAISAPKTTVSVQDADHGARIGDVTAGGFHTKPATDGTTTQSAFYKPAM